jgi:hypothetical protein
MALSDFPADLRENYQIHEWRHASAVLRTDFSGEWDDILSVLGGFKLCKSHITIAGGGKSKVAG